MAPTPFRAPAPAAVERPGFQRRERRLEGEAELHEAEPVPVLDEAERPADPDREPVREVVVGGRGEPLGEVRLAAAGEHGDGDDERDREDRLRRLVGDDGPPAGVLGPWPHPDI